MLNQLCHICIQKIFVSTIKTWIFTVQNTNTNNCSLIIAGLHLPFSFVKYEQSSFCNLIYNIINFFHLCCRYTIDKRYTYILDSNKSHNSNVHYLFVNSCFLFIIKIHLNIRFKSFTLIIC